MNVVTDATEIQVSLMAAEGWSHYEHDSIKPGVRVRNAGEQYLDALVKGTAEVLAVMRKTGAWEQKYGRPNIEVIVKRDRDGSLGWWQDYRTEVIEAAKS
jgi:hypothetical protein